MGKTSHTKGLRAAFFTLAIILGFALLSAQPQELYDQFYRRAHGMSTEEVINLGDRLAGQGHGDSAVAAYTVAINRFDRRLPQNEKIASIQAHQRAAEYWLSRGANLNALQVLMGARDISEAVGTDSLTIGILNNMAYVYLTFKNYEKAAAIFEEAYSLQSKRKDDDAEFKLLNNLASVHIMLDDTAKAKEELQRLKALHPSTKEVQQVAPYHIMLLEGALLNHSGRYNEGAESIKKAIDNVRNLPQGEILECLALEDLTKSYEGLHLRDSVLKSMLRCDELAGRLGLPDRQIDALKGLSKYYGQTGDKERALDYRHRYLTLSDSVMNYREFARLNNIEFIYQTDKYKSEISSLNQEGEMKARRLRYQLWIIAALVLVMFVIGTLLYIVWRQKRNLDQSYRTLFRLFQSSEKEPDKTSVAVVEETTPSTDTDKTKDVKYAQSGMKGESVYALGKTLRKLLDDPKVVCDPELNLAKLAELSGSNSKYVSQAVNETFGMNFASLLNERRIAHARRKLADPANSNLTIAAIAASAGYRNQTSFIAAFKKSTGMTPSTFMKIAKEQRSTQSNS